MLKRGLWVLGGIVGTVLLLVLAWIASNWVDTAEQPWPQSLVVPTDAIPPADNLYDQLVAAPRGTGPTLTLGDCEPGGCANAWEQRRPQWAAQRAPHAALGAVCERATQSASLRFQDPLPLNWSFESALGEYQLVSACNNWLLMRALEASHQANSVLALQLLQQSQGLSRAVIQGSRLLVGHVVGVAMHERTLHALLIVAEQHPQLADRLVPLADLSTADLAQGQRRWMAAEANFMRGMVLNMAQPKTCEAYGFALEGVVCRLGGGSTMPNYTTHLFTDYWLRAQGTVEDTNPLAVANAMEAIAAAPETGLFGTPWHWRGTVPHILLDVARPAFGTYVERGFNTYLASLSTKLWLQARAQGVPPAQQNDWFAERMQGTPLAGRLRLLADGTWSLQAARPGSAHSKAPQVWPR